MVANNDKGYLLHSIKLKSKTGLVQLCGSLVRIHEPPGVKTPLFIQELSR